MKFAKKIADHIVENGLEFGGRFEDIELVLELAKKLKPKPKGKTQKQIVLDILAQYPKSTVYIAALQKMVSAASPKAMVICRAQHSHFAEPGWGGVEFVTIELSKAEQVVIALESGLN